VGIATAIFKGFGIRIAFAVGLDEWLALRSNRFPALESKFGGISSMNAGSAPSSGVIQEILWLILEGEQAQSVDECLEADHPAPSIHVKPCSLNVQLIARGDSCQSSHGRQRFS
jgi:hypothetical protein